LLPDETVREPSLEPNDGITEVREGGALVVVKSHLLHDLPHDQVRVHHHRKSAYPHVESQSQTPNEPRILGDVVRHLRLGAQVGTALKERLTLGG
jgi:hypothetical protein